MSNNILFDYQIPYFFIGLIAFFIPKFVNSFNFFGLEAKKSPEIRPSMFFYYIIGVIFYMFVIEDIVFKFVFTRGLAIPSDLLLELIPDLLILIIGFIFISEAFIEPTKNSLISLTIISAICFPLSFFLFHSRLFVGLFSYSYVIGPLLALAIGIILGYLLHRILKEKASKFNDVLWSARPFWKIANNTWFLGILLLLAITETLFQLSGLTMLFPLKFLFIS